jgi:hypothetical protein
MDKNSRAAAEDLFFQVFDSFVSLVGMIGCFLAVYMSWVANQSLLWAIAHGWLGWIYVFWHLNYNVLCAVTASSLLTGYMVRYNILKSRYEKSRSFFNVLTGIQERLRREREQRQQDQEKDQQG